MKVKFSDLTFFNNIVKKEIEIKLAELISNSKFIGGDEKLKFEREFANYINVKNCIGVGNCTDALEIAIESLDLKPQSEIIVPSNSFIATSEAVTRSGHKIVFADCNPDNYTISVDSIKQNLTKNTSAIIVVHLYGQTADMDRIFEVIQNHNIKVIEDCAQAHGALYKGEKAGSIGDVGVFSFYPGKNLGAFGDAGCIVTNNKILAENSRMISNHGRLDKYNHKFEGRNSRLDTIQAAILSIKLKHLDKINNIRIQNANYYYKGLSEVDNIVLPKNENWGMSVFHQFVIRVENRKKLIEFLKNQGIDTGIHYPIALPNLKAYDYLNKDYSKYFATQNDSNILSLPISEHLKIEEITYIIEKLKCFYNE